MGSVEKGRGGNQSLISGCKYQETVWIEIQEVSATYLKRHTNSYFNPNSLPVLTSINHTPPSDTCAHFDHFTSTPHESTSFFIHSFYSSYLHSTAACSFLPSFTYFCIYIYILKQWNVCFTTRFMCQNFCLVEISTAWPCSKFPYSGLMSIR